MPKIRQRVGKLFNKSNIMIKKDVTYGDWRIVRHDDSKMEVYKNG